VHVFSDCNMNLTRKTPEFHLVRLSQQAGRTLLELMVAITIGLVVIGAALAVYSSTTSGSRVSETESRLNENAALALGLLQQQIRLAGYSAIVGPSTFPANARKNLEGAGIRGCTGGITSVTSAVAFGSIACNNVTTSSDALVVRYEADTANTTPVSGAPSNCVGSAITASVVSSATLTGSTLTIPNYALADNRYYVQTTGTPSGGPELYCVGATNTSTFSTPQSIMEGVERVDLTFGVAASATATVTVAYMSANDIDTTYSAESVSDRWKRVLTARVCLLMRNTASSDLSSKSAITATAKYYDCNNTLQTSTDGYLRRAYTSTILLKNRLSP
jgi:type IV pilus assembly protein PilW